MQEVQRQWNTYQENHEIEQIWYSSRKVSDKTQVRDKQTFWISFSETNTRVLFEDDHSDYNQMPFSWNISEDYWDTEFKITGWDIRMPLYWWYRLSWYMYWWSGNAYIWFDFRINGKSIKQFETKSVSVQVPFDFTINVWKYDILSVRVRINYSGYSTISWTAYMQLNITKL